MVKLYTAIESSSAKKVETKEYVQRSDYSPTKVNTYQPLKRVDNFLKTCVYHGKGIHPRKFCRRWFGLEDKDQYGRQRYTELQILAIECEHGYREQCINLIARVLKIKPNTIHRWGKGVEFNKIPLSKREEYEMYLSYVDTIRAMSQYVARFDEDILRDLLHCLDLQQFSPK